jgi:diaminopimelate epimerase
MLKFIKMHGLGNDFMVIDGVTNEINLSAAEIRALSNRHTGVGFDQCLLVTKSNDSQIDFFYKIYNSNGTEVSQCGNGARCLARFIQFLGLTDKKVIWVATNSTKMRLTIENDDSVTIDFEKPILTPAAIPFLATQQQIYYPIKINDEIINMHVINVGNPHAILVVDNLTDEYVASVGQSISLHDLFPEQTNVGFMTILSSKHILLRVYERGCGETLACGSGAVAAAAIGRLYHNLDKEVKVSLAGGDLRVMWDNFNKPISLNGPATFVYQGVLENICV